MAKKQYLDMTGLQHYDAKVAERENTKDAAALKSAKDYADSLAVNYDAAGTAQTKVNELAEGAVAGNTAAIATLNGTGAGSVAKAVADAKSELNNTISGVEGKADAAQGAADKAQGDVDALAGKVGTVPGGQTVMGIIENIQENAYDDTAIRALIQTNADDIGALEDRATTIEGNVSANAAAITTLNGTGAGSVKKQIDDAFNEFATNMSDDKVVNTYKELIDYCAEHGSEAAEMAGNIDKNASAIEDLEKFIGALPEGTSATDVIGYINAKVAAEASRAEGIEAGLEGRLSAVEGKLGAGAGSVSEQISTAKSEAIDAAAADAKSKADQALVDAKAYADQKVAAVDLSGIEANADAIEALGGRVSTNEGDITTLKTAVNTTLPNSIADAKKAGTDAQADVDALEGTVNTLSGKVTTNTNNISSLTDRVGAVEGLVGEGFEPITNAAIDGWFTNN